MFFQGEGNSEIYFVIQVWLMTVVIVLYLYIHEFGGGAVGDVISLNHTGSVDGEAL